VNAGLTLLYWQIGQRIRTDVLQKKRAEYGEEICSYDAIVRNMRERGSSLAWRAGLVRTDNLPLAVCDVVMFDYKI
jgi:hypothetical protein